MTRLLCFFGIHRWVLVRKVLVEDSGPTYDPGDFRPGGFDCHWRCLRCPATEVEHMRGFDDAARV